jgi:hypothetical protein
VREWLFDGFVGTASTLVEQEFRLFVDLGNHGAVARALNKALDLS